MTIAVAVLDAVDDRLAAKLRDLAGRDLDLRFAPTPDEAGFAKVLPGARYAVVRGVRMAARLLDLAPDLALGGAGLDVFGREPPDPSDPLLSLPNTVLTPHVSGRTEDNLARMVRHWSANIRAHHAGRALDAQDLVAEDLR
jgi:lactate dehydrogenase-like 2-hydroxyacid dehydrogenase